jgi:uncharacterized protein
MENMNKPDNLRRLLSLIYQEIFKIDDTPQKIALGLSIGIFTGVLPGAGPIAALFLAYLLRANRAAALFASLLTNTWVSIVVFVFALHIGANLFDVTWKIAREEWNYFLKTLHWSGLFKVSFFKAILPTLIGYLIIAVVLAALTYFIMLLLLKKQNKSTNNKTNA